MRLTYLRSGKKDRDYHTYSWYRCECGTEKEIRDHHVRSRVIVSCGCYGKKRRAEANSWSKKGNTYGRKLKGRVSPTKGKICVRYPNGRRVYISKEAPLRTATA